MTGCKRALTVALVVAMCCTACAKSTLQFSGRRAYRHAQKLVSLGPRYVGSPGNIAAGDYIAAECRRRGWDVSVQTFAFGDQSLRNIVARKGTGTAIALIGTHYDTRALADRDPRDRTEPVPGANDGASGSAVLLELARVLNTPAHGQGQVWLVFFDGEDRGEIENWPYSVGAYQMVTDLARGGGSKPSYVVVVDMIGDRDQRIYYEWSSTLALNEHIWQIARDLGYASQFVRESRHHILDDHTPFVQWGVPATLLIDFDYPYWHTTQDTLDKISADSLQRVGRVLETLLNGEPFAFR